MSRLEGRSVKPTLESIDVALFFEEIELALARTVSPRKLESSAPAATWVRADYGLLTQAVTNLVENAARYSAPEAPIRLEARADPGRVRLTVADCGPPISADDVPHVFEKFYRGRGTTSVSGTGLGLALVKAIVELCGGQVSLESNPSGNRFVISLPSGVAPQ
jgi:two-component system sensor histidine kinase BaeS